MSWAQRREACRRWGHLPAGARCARCGHLLPVPGLPHPHKVALVIVLAIAAALVGAAFGAWLDYLRSR